VSLYFSEEEREGRGRRKMGVGEVVERATSIMIERERCGGKERVEIYKNC
jgi:hypothetical protein